MNKVWETGRLTMEPNVRYNSVKNADGQTEERVVASYNLAVTRSYNQQTAETPDNLEGEFQDISNMVDEELPFR